MEHKFTPTIFEKLQAKFGNDANAIYRMSPLLQYLNIKTRSAERGSKARGSFANLHAIYVLVEDYLAGKFNRKKGAYKDYEGAQFSSLFKRQRELPFGQKLQNHALNARLNDEFHKYFSQVGAQPIIRNVDTNRYWFNENLLLVTANKQEFNIAAAVITIIDSYVAAKQDAFSKFIEAFEKLRDLEAGVNSHKAVLEITDMLAPNVDARIFEIVSYSILKYHYHHQVVFFGFDVKKLNKENLTLYKTGRTNANDGGIDFVMRPLGRFFQVTETTDVRKYFLDIDKIQRFPITFVVKSEQKVEELKAHIREKAAEEYPVTSVVDRYMGCIEEIINVPLLLERFKEAIGKGYLPAIIDEIIRQSKVEFNYEDIEDEAVASAVEKN